MTEKQKYISAFLEGYFSEKKIVVFGSKYYKMLDTAVEKAEEKWKQYESNDCERNIL